MSAILNILMTVWGENAVTFFENTSVKGMILQHALSDEEVSFLERLAGVETVCPLAYRVFS